MVNEAGSQHSRLPTLLTHPVSLWLVLALVVASFLLSLAVGWLLFGREGQSDQNLGSQPASGHEAVDWRQGEYDKIAQLRGGIALERFREVLGVPLFVTSSEDGQFTQYLFQGRDYWVQAIADASGAVQLMSVTSCAEDFQPTFGGVTGSSPALRSIVLNSTRFDQVGPPPSRLRYFTSGATASSYYYDEDYLGNPGHYKTYFVGINDACKYQVSDDLRRPFLGQPPQREYQAVQVDPAVQAFRANAVANTYGETAAFFDERALESFQIGASRILVRTAPPFPTR